PSTDYIFSLRFSLFTHTTLCSLYSLSLHDALPILADEPDSAGVGNDAGSGPITVRSLRARVLSQSCSSGGKGTRTPNPLLAKQMRYQLRHTPVRVLTLTPNRCARTIRPGRLGSHAATGRRFRVPRA